MAGRGKSLAAGTAKKSTSQSSKAGLQFLVDRIAHFLKTGKYTERVGGGAPVYLAAVLEYLATEVSLQLQILLLSFLLKVNVYFFVINFKKKFCAVNFHFFLGFGIG